MSVVSHISRGSTARSRHAARSLDVSRASVRDNPDRERFDLWYGDQLVGILGYRTRGEVGATGRSAGVVVLLHTVVEEEYSGHGLAALLVRAALDSARRRHQHVQPLCTYVQHYLAKHPGDEDLVAA